MKALQSTLTSAYKYRFLLSLAIVSLQVLTLVLDLVFLPDTPDFLFLALAEAMLPWLLYPLISRYGPKVLHTFLAESKSAKMIIDFSLQIGGLILLVLFAFQVLQWFFAGEYHGGVFYFGTMYALVLNAVLQQKYPIKNESAR